MKSHRTDLLSLTFGLLFVGTAAWWLVAQLLDLTLPSIGWFLAGGLILLGVLGLVGAFRAGRAAGTASDGPAGAGEPVQPVTAPVEPVSGGSGATGPVDSPSWLRDDDHR